MLFGLSFMMSRGVAGSSIMARRPSGVSASAIWGKVFLRWCQACDIGDGRNSNLSQFLDQEFPVIDHMVRATFTHPRLVFRVRSRTDDCEVGELPGKLQQNGPDAPHSANDKKLIADGKRIAQNLEPVERKFPRRNAGKWKRHCLACRRRWFSFAVPKSTARITEPSTLRH
jgi:hypothetical protein